MAAGYKTELPRRSHRRDAEIGGEQAEAAKVQAEAQRLEEIGEAMKR